MTTQSLHEKISDPVVTPNIIVSNYKVIHIKCDRRITYFIVQLISLHQQIYLLEKKSY
jgi:hypothetical protein